MRRRTLALLALAWPLWAGAQAPACTVPDHVPPAQLAGLWTLTLWPEGAQETQASSRGAVLFERHPEYTAGVRGELRRSGAGNDLTAVVSGDVTEGEFHLDESDDGKTMSAVWDGVAQDCAGQLSITGTRRPAEGRGEGTALRFRLERASGWR